jgi:hypothetical protein
MISVERPAFWLLFPLYSGRLRPPFSFPLVPVPG